MLLLLAIGIGVVSFLTFRSAFGHDTLIYLPTDGRGQPALFIAVDQGMGRPREGARTRPPTGRSSRADEHSDWAHRVNKLARADSGEEDDSGRSPGNLVAGPERREKERRGIAVVETTAITPKRDE